MESMRKCTKCGEEKDLALFPTKVKNGVLYHNHTCNKCRSARNTELIKADSERLEKKRAVDRERQKRLRVEEPERRKAIEAKRRETENYKQWSATDNKKRAAEREKRRLEVGAVLVEANMGVFSIVTPVCCAICAKPEVRKGDYTHRPIELRYCLSCGAIPGNQLKGLKFKTISLCCSDCGSSFMGTGKYDRCNDCRVRASRKMTKQRLRAMGINPSSNLRARARRSGVYVETVVPRKVFDRDKWRCVSCGCKVIMSKVYHPRQASVDHIIPLSMGGSHTYGNVQTMCVSCNSSKSNKITSSVQLTVFDMVRQ